MKCNLCNRRCNIDRQKKIGKCNCTDNIYIAKAMLHMFEEPVISGVNGSGAIFFSGCCLKCVFCQNYQISQQNVGKQIDVHRLAQIFKELKEKGAHNINLVNPTHYVYQIIKAIEIAKVDIPFVYNTSSYENIKTIKMLKGYIDIYLPDIKYFDNNLAKKYSNVNDYFKVASNNILEMLSQVGKPKVNNGIMQTGLIVRHLVMPSMVDDSLKIIEWLEKTFQDDEILLSVMSQYTPFYKSVEYKNINRRLTKKEYETVLEKVEYSGFDGFAQELSSAKEEYTPIFDLSGV